MSKKFTRLMAILLSLNLTFGTGTLSTARNAFSKGAL